MHLNVFDFYLNAFILFVYTQAIRTARVQLTILIYFTFITIFRLSVLSVACEYFITNDIKLHCFPVALCVPSFSYIILFYFLQNI